MRLLSGENATERTTLSCPRIGEEMSAPDLASHKRIVLSLEPDTILFPLGENVTDQTAPVWPRSGPRIRSPDLAPQTRMVPSPNPDAIRCPSGENATEEMTELGTC